MKTAELQAAIDAAEVTTVKGYDEKRYRVYSETLNRELIVPAKSADAARAAALDLILNESDRIRGFELTDKKA